MTRSSTFVRQDGLLQEYCNSNQQLRQEYGNSNQQLRQEYCKAISNS